MAKELISIEEKEQKKKKKKKNKKHKKALKVSHSSDICPCKTGKRCEISDFVAEITRNLITNSLKLATGTSPVRKQKKKPSKKHKKSKKPAETHEISRNISDSQTKPASFEDCFEKYEEKATNFEVSPSIDIKKSQSCDESKLLTASFSADSEDFIEVKKRKSNNLTRNSKFAKNERPASKFNKTPHKEQKKPEALKEKPQPREKTELCAVSQKKKSSLEEKAEKVSHKTESFAENGTASSDFSSRIDRELEKELKNPPNIHLSKNSKKKEENSSRTTCETRSPSQKTRYSSNNYFADEPFFDINLINIEDFRYDSMEDAQDAGFIEKVNGDLNEFLNEIQQDSSHLMNLRSLVFNRLLFVVSHLFPEIQINLRLYGSCATGLALPTSDMDVGIMGFETCSVYEITEILQILLGKLTFLKWVKTYKPIFTASIPVLKIVSFLSFFFINKYS